MTKKKPKKSPHRSDVYNRIHFSGVNSSKLLNTAQYKALVLVYDIAMQLIKRNGKFNQKAILKELRQAKNAQPNRTQLALNLMMLCTGSFKKNTNPPLRMTSSIVKGSKYKIVTYYRRYGDRG